MNQSTRNLIDNSTPFTVIATPDHTIHLYWTLKASTYGYQVVTVVFNHKSNDAPYVYKTNSGGFCKESDATHQAFLYIGRKPHDLRLGSGPVPHNYHIGGNFYKVPAQAMRVVK